MSMRSLRKCTYSKTRTAKEMMQVVNRLERSAKAMRLEITKKYMSWTDEEYIQA